MAIRVDIADPLERLKTWWEELTAPGVEITYDTSIRAHLTPLTSTVHAIPSPALSTTTFLLDVDFALCNRLHNLHGGAAATIFDFCTTLALTALAKEGFWQWGGVSRGLNVTYLKPAVEGMTVLVKCEVWSIGKRMAFIKGSMREWDDEKKQAKGAILCLCEHSKIDVALMPSAVKL